MCLFLLLLVFLLSSILIGIGNKWTFLKIIMAVGKSVGSFCTCVIIFNENVFYITETHSFKVVTVHSFNPYPVSICVILVSTGKVGTDVIFSLCFVD